MKPREICKGCGKPFVEVHTIEDTEKPARDAVDAAWDYINRQEVQIDHLAPAKGIINGILFSSIFWVMIILLIQIVRA